MLLQDCSQTFFCQELEVSNHTQQSRRFLRRNQRDCQRLLDRTIIEVETL
jgi:hypothetical protein